MFLTDLVVKELPDGRKELAQPLIYSSKEYDPVVVPSGYKTDYASVPRLPFVYLVFNGISPKASTMHDFLYSTVMTIKEKDAKGKRRSRADHMFLEAMKAEKTPFHIRWLAFIAVRAFGGAHMKLTGDDDA